MKEQITLCVHLHIYIIFSQRAAQNYRQYAYIYKKLVWVVLMRVSSIVYPWQMRRQSLIYFWNTCIIKYMVLYYIMEYNSTKLKQCLRGFIFTVLTSNMPCIGVFNGILLSNLTVLWPEFESLTHFGSFFTFKG